VWVLKLNSPICEIDMPKKHAPDIVRCQALDLFASAFLAEPTPCGEPATKVIPFASRENVPLCAEHAECGEGVAFMPPHEPKRMVGADRRG
jgi:hypothetical protein